MGRRTSLGANPGLIRDRVSNLSISPLNALLSGQRDLFTVLCGGLRPPRRPRGQSEAKAAGLRDRCVTARLG